MVLILMVCALAKNALVKYTKSEYGSALENDDSILLQSNFTCYFFTMVNDYPDNSRHNMTKNLQNSKFYFFESNLKTYKNL